MAESVTHKKHSYKTSDVITVAQITSISLYVILIYLILACTVSESSIVICRGCTGDDAVSPPGSGIVSWTFPDMFSTNTPMGSMNSSALVLSENNITG